MKNSKWLALLLVFVLVSALVPSALAADYVEPFTDVPAKQYYADPVSWAVEQEITNGMTATTFAPDATCTRAQIVTFLYRAEGKPAVSDVKNPFTDTVKGAWYEDAMLWAVGNEITTGMTATTFEPNTTCNRAQIVTFLYRVAGKPAVSGVKNPFTDTVKGEWYEDAMLWAVQNEITNGVSKTEFAPGKTCTRGEAVTFLYRYYHLAEPGYVLMNIPYADFYGQIVGDANGTGIDAFTSATTKKATYFWDSSYKGNAPVAYGEGSTIEGVQFPVLITKADLAKLSGLSSADAYYCQELSNAPKLSVKATVGEDGSVSFAKLSARATVLTDATATITDDTKHGDYMIEIADDGGILTEADNTTFQVYGAILTTAEGTYPVRHLANLYYKDFQQIALITTENESGKGQKDAAYAFYAELVGQTITSITFYTNSGIYQVNTSLLVGAEPESGYVLMNIPYADFYAAEGTSDVDAVTSATLNKTRTAGLAGGSYHKDPTGTDISGIVYPVYVADMKLLDGLKEVKDTDTVTITVTNRGQTTETTFTGKDALFENADYAYYKLDSAPKVYKTMTKGADGKLSFSAVNAEAKKVEMTAALTYGGHHTDVTYKVTCDALPQSGVTVNGVVITAGGTQYALRHVYEIWRVTELGWNWDQLDGSGLSGKTITNITYYITNAEGQYEVLTCDVSDTLKLKPAAITASFVDASTIALSGIPADAQNVKVTVKDQVGRGETATVFADAVSVQDGKVVLTTPAVEGKNYVVSFVSDNYADSSVTISFGVVE